MKEGWERTGEPASLNVKQLNKMIQSAFPGKRIRTAERLGVGLSNSNYKIVLEQGNTPYVLRLYRGNSTVAAKEQDIANWVRGTVPVAEFIHLDASCTIYDQSWAVLEWKEGGLLHDVLKNGTNEDIVSAAASVGSTLAQIHRYSFSESGFIEKDLCISQPIPMNGEQFIVILEQMIFQSPCARWLGEELTQKLWSLCQVNASLLSQADEKPVLVHSDFNGLNILIQQDQSGCTVSAVLDWEFAFSWRRHVDIANMLRYEEEGSHFERHFIQAYMEHGGVLQENWKLVSKLEDLVALCDMLSHCTEDMSNRIRDLKQLVANTVQRYG
ncbi:aminoglycoside phosphotransferase family protein [Paenibacillus sp. RC67]|uniref:phosphotransferase family protein n=1 Tax=Paenibacillus sp. RC67 TaxID=3039392 RepID=UPI0024AE4472|nr:aminoglycoside phosphotransferase family protein [Paenibacillus sp. RC67]